MLQIHALLHELQVLTVSRWEVLWYHMHNTGGHRLKLKKRVSFATKILEVAILSVSIF